MKRKQRRRGDKEKTKRVMEREGEEMRKEVEGNGEPLASFLEALTEEEKLMVPFHFRVHPAIHTTIKGGGGGGGGR